MRMTSHGQIVASVLSITGLSTTSGRLMLCTEWLQLLPAKLWCCAHLQLVCWLFHPQLAQHICLLSSQPAGSSTADTHSMAVAYCVWQTN
jgi:hypothetical protein